MDSATSRSSRPRQSPFQPKRLISFVALWAPNQNVVEKLLEQPNPGVLRGTGKGFATFPLNPAPTQHELLRIF